MLNKYAKLALMGLVILIIIAGCTGQKSERTEVKSDSEKEIMQQPDMSINKVDDTSTHSLARYIHSVVSGEIKPNDNIKVKFIAPMIEEDELGKEINSRLFSFKPAIKGKAYWEKRDLLIFKPNNALPQRQNYKGKIDINPLIDDAVNINPLNFEFTVMGMELTHYKANIQKENKDLIFQGEVGFTLPVTLKDLKKGFSIYLDNEPLRISWDEIRDSEEFTFKTETINQSEKQKNIKVKVDKDILNLSEDYLRTQTLASMREMAVMRVSTDVTQDKPQLEVEFSEVLADDQDVDDYINFYPYIESSIRKFDKKIIITGNFDFGSEYQLSIKAGVRNIFGEKTAVNFTKNIVFSDQKPQIMFSQNGAIMPSDNQQIITFRTLNLKVVDLEIKKVFDNNLIYFLQEGSYQSDRSLNNYYYYGMSRVGEQVYTKRLQIGDKKNKWLQHELDLSQLIPKNDQGLYLVSLKFNESQILYEGPKIDNNSNSWYTNPYSRGYYYRNGTIYKPLVISDLGVTAKQAGNNCLVFVNNVLTTEPVNNANVKLYSYNNQIITEGKTNSNGMVNLDAHSKDPFFIIAEYDGQRSIVKTSEMQWNLSTFDVDGIETDVNKTRLYLYTERGVYRPGDPINISMVLRNQNGTFPENHPVKVAIINPRNQRIYDTVLNEAKDGFYHLQYITEPTDPTGNWKIQIETGGKEFYHDLKIETVVAERLKLVIKPEKDNLKWDDQTINLKLQGNYLFGNPASGLQAKLTQELLAIPKTFKQSKWNNYNFTDQTIDFQAKNVELFNNTLDDQGQATIDWQIPINIKAPSALMIKLEGEVMEHGGRSSKAKYYLPYDPYEYFVGIETENEKWSKIGEENQYNFILLDSNGKAVAGKDISVRIYRNRNYWWWEYDRRRNSGIHFKTDVETELLQEIEIISGAKAQSIKFTPDQWGQYLIEAVIDGEQQHSASQFFYASYWGRMDGGMKNAGLLTIQSDKQEYKVGDTAVISFPIPEKSNAIITFEKNDTIVDQYLYKGKKPNNQGSIEVKITPEMLPNIYCSISVLQPHAQTDNDRPVRMFGVIPINVFDPTTKQNLVLTVPDTLKPNASFTCRIQTEDKMKTQFTIAVVDEGLLSLTDYSSPNAWKEFFRKIRLAVKTFDNYSYFLGVNRGDIFKRFSVGGGMAFGAWQKKELASEESKRFEPVSMFKGPLETDDNGYAEVSFDMPDYVGAVRIMLVSATGNRYGNIDRTVMVKKDLMVLPTLPRKLSPDDMFAIPVDVFVSNKNINSVDLSLQTDDLISVTSSKKQTINFSEPGQKTVEFMAKVDDKIGVSKIEIKAISKEEKTLSKIEIPVSPSSSRIYDSKRYEINTGENITITVPEFGIEGTREAELVLFRHQKLDLLKRLEYLNSYPYGCLEQTVSAVFPQLFLGQLMTPDQYTSGMVSENINQAVKRLSKFQLPNGGLTYWPGNRKVSEWGSCYTGHFLVEAEDEGFFVSNQIKSQLWRYLKSVTIKDNNKDFLDLNQSNRKIQLYRIYVLAKMNKAEISAMNYLHEEYLNTLDDTERWMLAAAYQLAGMQTIATEIVRTTGIVVSDYNELGGSFGSALRDKAIILNCSLDLDAEDIADQLYETISDALDSEVWYNTQTLGYSLLALGRYIKLHPEFFNDALVEGEVIFSDNEKKNFELDKNLVKINLDGRWGESFEIRVGDNSEVKSLFSSLKWSAVPINPSNNKIIRGIDLSIHYEDKEGNIIDPTELEQGTIFTQITEISSPEVFTLENVALVQLLPSGWEVENDRINTDRFSENREDYNAPDYIDIRDDRVLSFFDLKHDQIITVRNKLRAVTVGEFTLPPTKCETMYSEKYRAVEPGQKIKVVSK